MQTPQQALIVVRDQFALKGLSDDALKLILPAYQEALQRVLAGLQTMPEASLERQMWLKQQLATIRAQFGPVADRIYNILPEAQARAFEEGISNAQKYLEAGGVKPAAVGQPVEVAGTTTAGDVVSVTGRGMEVPGADGFLRPGITRQQVIAAAKETGFSVFAPGGTERSLQDVLPQWLKAESSEIEKKLRTGFLLGSSTDEIIRDVADGRGGRARVEAIVRTSMAEASQAAHDAFYEANEDLLLKTKSGYKWWWDASNDSRLCEVCAPLDGVKFKERSSPPHSWPAHWNCRCKILPYTALMELREEEGRLPKGGFLEATPVEYDKKGKRKPPPKG
ncbi:MAG: phage minor head protein, partial [Vulcanococcus sp.]